MWEEFMKTQGVSTNNKLTMEKSPKVGEWGEPLQNVHRKPLKQQTEGIQPQCEGLDFSKDMGTRKEWILGAEQKWRIERSEY